MRGRPGRRWLRRLTLLVAALILARIVANIVANASQLDPTRVLHEPSRLAGACTLWLGAFAFRAWLWGELMRRTGYPIGHLAGARVFVASHLGRYLPGKMWSVLGAGVFGREAGIPASAGVVGMTVFLVMYYILGSAAALLVIGRVSQAHAWVAAGVGLVGLGALAFMASPWFPRLLRWLAGKVGRDLGDLKLPSPRVLFATGVGLAAVWWVTGIAFGWMVHGIVPSDLPRLSALDAVGTYASALVAGFAVLLAPSGLGVREAVMTALLRAPYGVAYAGMIALTARVVMTVLELGLSLWGIGPHLLRRRRARHP